MAYGNQYSPPGGNEEEKDQGEGTGGTGGKEEVTYEVGEVSFVEHAGPLSQDKPEISIVGIDEPYVEPIDPIPSPISGQIKFRKIIYSQNAFRRKVDVSISELKPKEEEIDISKFFKQYNKIFFDIPKIGEESHTTLITTSKDFIMNYVDPKDVVIEGLESQIIELEEELANPDNEHPIFPNGSLLRVIEEDEMYYMDQGYRRRVWWEEGLWEAIRIARHGSNDDSTDIPLPKHAVDQIRQGFPSLKMYNLGIPFDPNLTEVRQRIASIQFNYLRDEVIDGVDATALNASEFDQRSEYLDKLEQAITNKGLAIDSLGNYMNGVREQIKTLRALDLDFYNTEYGDLLNGGAYFIEDTGSGTDSTGGEIEYEQDAK